MDMGDMGDKGDKGEGVGGRDEQRNGDGRMGLGRREKEKRLLEKQQTSTSGVNTHAVANAGATEQSWWSSIEK